MVEIRLQQDNVEIEVLGWHKLWAFKNRLSVPLSAVRGVRPLDSHEALGWWKGLRVPGTHLPGVIIAGTFYRHGELHFWDVRRAHSALEIELSSGRYRRLFVEVEDREQTLELLRSAGVP